MTWVLNASEEVDNESQWPMIIAVCTALSFFSIVIVCGRLWIRFSGRGLAADDYVAALSLVFALVYSILCIVQTRYGLGLPIADRPDADLDTYTVVNYAGRPFYQLGICFFKIALLISYLRLLQGTDQRNYRRIVWIIIVGVFVGHLACTFCLIFACDPVNKSWEPDVEGTCLPAGPSFTGYAMVTIASDVIVTLVPIPVLWSLNIPMSKKVGLIGIFALGMFTTICSILRYLTIDNIQNGDGNSTMLVVWGVIEFSVGNVVSSLPFLAPVFLKKAKAYRTKGYSGGSTDGKSKSRNFRPFKAIEEYKLSKLGTSSKGGAFSTIRSASDTKSGSEENILANVNDHSIMKSVTYTVQVDDEAKSKDLDLGRVESRGKAI